MQRLVFAGELECRIGPLQHLLPRFNYPPGKGIIMGNWKTTGNESAGPLNWLPFGRTTHVEVEDTDSGEKKTVVVATESSPEERAAEVGRAIANGNFKE